ncbi:DNA polymerase III subunit delta [Wolbachia pipientis]|uniref:DNA-directed DNA polymerase n=1 Tax=Wolbachia pipientis TaxID=955 RepID=A0A1E7QJH5_WOLPI|nr:hypothetical protein [Wolbachia pipientis]OEY86374.1 DNA polymerase III subunit delta [Wolbachia pipientis]
MKITFNKVNSFLEKPGSLKGILIYGNDNSKIDFYAKKLVTNLGGYSVQLMDFTVVNKSPELLFTELATISMFNEKKLIKLVNISGNISKELIFCIDNNIGDNYIIMIAGELSYNSAIKNYIENSQLFGVIACYKDNHDHLYNIISDCLEQNCVKYTKDSVYHLQYYFNNSKAPIRTELEKLLLYIGERKELNHIDVKECFSGSGNSHAVLDNLCAAVANKDIVNFIRVSDTLINNENFSSIAIIRMLSNYFLQLEAVLLLIDSGMSALNAIDQLNPPLFFKQLQNFKSHLKSLSLSELKVILECLVNLEIICKKVNLDHKMLFQHIISFLLISQDPTEVSLN